MAVRWLKTVDAYLCENRLGWGMDGDPVCLCSDTRMTVVHAENNSAAIRNLFRVEVEGRYSSGLGFVTNRINAAS